MLLKIIIFLTVWNEISGVCRLSDIHIEHGQFVYENDGDQNRSTVPRNYVLLFQCDGGYELSEWRSIYCDGKKWNNGPPHCIKVCSEPGLSFHGFRNNGTCCSVGNTLTYSCIEGYRLVGDKEITCLPGGKWSAPRPRCRPPINICPDPPTIANGMIEPFIGLKHGDFYMPFEKIRIVCNKGFVYHGTSNVLSCEKANSQWSAEFGECREAFCPRPYIAHGSIIELENNTATKFPENFEITYVCNTGFRLIFDYIRDCSTGKWSGYNPYCEKIICPDPKIPEDGKRSGGDFNVGSKVVFSCSPDYVLLGSAERHCLPNGQWSGELTRCSSGSTHCPDPGIPINGRRIGNDFGSGDTVRFTCEDDFVLTGSHESECLPDGSWSGTQTICRDVDDFDDENTVADTLISVLDEAGKNPTEHNYWYPNHPQMVILYFAFDVSRDMREKNFKSSIRFAQALVKKVGASKGNIRIGAITFSYRAKIHFFPANFTTTEEVSEALDEIKYEEDGTWRKSASKVIREEMMPLSREQFGHDDLKSVIFFLTSGRTEMDNYPAIQGGLLIDAGCEIYCIGMTGDKRKGELYDLASWPLNKHVFILKNYLALDWISQEILIDFSQCGLILENRRKTRLIGSGHLTEPWPWVAELYEKYRKRRFCGGAVIGRKWILTAASCLDATNTSHLKIKLGSTQGTIDTTLQEYKVEKVFIEPVYSRRRNFNSNIGLIKLNREIKYNRYVRPICLPPEELPENSSLYKPKERVKAIRWDFLKENWQRNYDLQEIDQPLQSYDTCMEYLRNHTRKLVLFSDHILCTGMNENQTSRSGGVCMDGGGNPLMQSQMNNEGHGYWTLIGILSYIYGCITSDTYMFYTHVQKYLPWIHSILNGDQI